MARTSVALLATASISMLGLAPAGAETSAASATQSSQGVAADGVTSTTALASTLPLVFPTPQEITAQDGSVPLNGPVSIVAGASVDQPALQRLQALISAQGGTATVVAPGVAPSPTGTTIYLGTNRDNSDVAAQVATTGKSLDGVGAEGYILDARGHTIVLAGVDAAGAYYSVVSLEQLAKGGSAKAATIRDWPGMAIRGSIEGFYGLPWSHQARLDQFAFYSKIKMNTYIYSPKDDPYLRANWKAAYPAAQLADLKDLVTTANKNHVNFTYALSPGLNICFSSPDDLKALTDKFQSLWDIGVHSFNIPFDDIDNSRWNCQADTDKFGPASGDESAVAQSYFLNLVNQNFIKTHAGAQPLQMVPTDYSGTARSGYRDNLASHLDNDVLVQWTGNSVWSAEISRANVDDASASYGHKILIWDNYPTNDCCSSQIFLAPLSGRSTDQNEGVEGYTSNPLNQSYVSERTLYDFGLYTWNNAAYNMNTSLGWSLKDMAGDDAKVQNALGDFVDVNWASRIESTQAPLLSADVASFWAGQSKTPFDSDLWRRLTELSNLNATLQGIPAQGFYKEAQPWILATENEAKATMAAIQNYYAQQCNDAALRDSSKSDYDKYRAAADANALTTAGGPIPAHVGNGVFEAVQQRALSGNVAANASTNLGTYGGNVVARAADGDDSSFYWSDGPPSASSFVSRDLGSTWTLNTLSVKQGSDASDANGDILLAGKLQTSVDGQTWVDAGTVSGPETTVTFSAPVSARYIRVVSTGSQTNWWKVRELSVTGTAGASSDNGTVCAAR